MRKKTLIPALPRPEFKNVEEALRGLDAASEDGNGILPGVCGLDVRLLEATPRARTSRPS